jgi:uncharacterized membrane protein (UPF0127 family)
MTALSRVALLAAAFFFFRAGLPASAADLQKIEIASKGATHPFNVELALTDDQRARGLMFRKALPDGQGMLFDFKVEQDVGFWMKNTYIPLDMIFIRADGTIRRIAANTEPLSERLVPSGGPIRFVLEVSGGTARKLGIEPGNKVTGAPLR